MDTSSIASPTTGHSKQLRIVLPDIIFKNNEAAHCENNCIETLEEVFEQSLCACPKPAAPERSVSVNDSCDQSSLCNEFVVGRSIKTRVLKKINGGSFGSIHLGELVDSGNRVAVKLELQNSPNLQLMSEGNAYRHLDGGPGIPKVHWFGLHEPLYNVMVMDLLGPSLQDLFTYCDHRFSLKTTLMLVDQMLETMDFIHQHQYIHRDVKPDNFVVGLEENMNRVFIVDFGLAKKITPKRFSIGHVTSPILRGLIGTVRYASVHAHMGFDEGVQDDLESLVYCWVYFLKGSLPWQGIPAKRREEKLSRIMDMKKSITSEELCQGLPSVFPKFLERVKRMRKEEQLDYTRVRAAFKKVADGNNIVYDSEFDWIVKMRETGEVSLSRIGTGLRHTSG